MGRYHWKEDKLFSKTEEFLYRTLGAKQEIEEKEIAIMVVLIYSAKGIIESLKLDRIGSP